MAIDLLETGGFSERDIFIYDRGYASYELLAKFTQHSRHYVVRCPKNSFKPAKSLFDRIGCWSKTVTLAVHKNQKKYILEKGLPLEIKVRFVSVILSTGEVEVLATSLMEESIQREDFQQLYFLRWGVLGGLRRETYGWYDHEDFFWDKRQTLHGLIGHPLVFHRENRDIPLELVKGIIELQVEKTEQGYHFALSKYSTESKVFLEQDTPNRYRVVDCSEETVAICKILSEKGMTVPFQAKEKVIDIICHARNSIHIQSDVAR